MDKLYTYHPCVAKASFAKRRWLALGHAVRGIGFCCTKATHFKIQLIVALLVIGMGWLLGLSKLEWAVVGLCIAGVLALEAINSAIEHLCNVLHPDFHPGIGVVKDVAAGAVLIGALGSCLVGGIVFLPKLFLLLH